VATEILVSGSCETLSRQIILMDNGIRVANVLGSFSSPRIYAADFL